MNIGVFTDTFKPATNGVVDAVWRLCKGFKKAGHNVWLFAVSDKDGEEIKEGIYIYKFKGKISSLYPGIHIRFRPPIRKISRIIKENNIKILHSNAHLGLGLAAVIISWRYKIPLISTFHTLLPNFVDSYLRGFEQGTAKKPTLLKIAEKIKLDKPLIGLVKKIVWLWMKYFNTSELIIVPSKFTKRILISHGIDKNKIIVIPNAIETQKTKVKKEENLILHVGRLSNEKRVDILIKALKYVKHDFKAVITSDGPMRKYLEELAKKEGVDKKVKFTGFISRKELNKLYDKATIFVSPAEYDTFNNCVAEALTHGIPVIINKNSGATDFVINGKNGLICKTDDPKEYAKKIDWLLFNEEVRRKLSKAGEWVRKYTSIDNIIQKMENIITTIKKKSRFVRIRSFIEYLIANIPTAILIKISNILERRINKNIS